MTPESQLENLVDNQVCIVGMGPIVNANVDIDDITTEQLAGIFTGQITDWSEVGGTAGTINVINREAGSGTRATFEAAVLQGAEVPADFTPVAEVDSSGTVVEQVAATEGSISYVAFNYYETNEGIKALSVDGVEPTQENVESGDFNIWAYSTCTPVPTRTRPRLPSPRRSSTTSCPRTSRARPSSSRASSR